MRLSSSIEEKKLPSLLGNERGCGAFERGGEKEAAITDEGSSDATSRRRISYALAPRSLSGRAPGKNFVGG